MPTLDSLQSKLIFSFSITLITIMVAVLSQVYFFAKSNAFPEMTVFGLTLLLITSIASISVAYALFINRAAFQPLKEISVFLSEVASKKDFSMRMRESGAKEVKSICRAVNNLISTIEELQRRDLERMNELDRLVKERTAELEKYSKHLEDLVREKTEELREKERLAAIGEMALMVGHDLRNPLQVIMYSTYLAKGATSNPNSVKSSNGAPITEYLNRIDDAVSYMNKIVSDLQDLSRPMKVNKESVLLRSILEDALSQVTIPSNVEVIVDSDPSLTASVDAGLICRALVNIIINAVQAMPNGGKLKLYAGMEGGAISFSVSDTGPGIPDEIRGNLFRPFQTTKPKGVGLGLVVVKRIVDVLKGSIEIDSKPNEGTRFTIRIPSTD